ncbi:hypothetical protein N0V90_002326 [Kalmusia sp. IMI 367209]|nr:hypothetical protein N0V90_002326 [Kalmusia sp. IMI 367209]
MDRLYLREELQKEKQEKNRISEDKKRRDRRMAERDLQLSGEQKVEDTFPASAESKLPFLEWYEFKNLGRTEGKVIYVIDVLIGDPIVDDDVGTTRYWFGSSGRRSKKNVVQSAGQKSLNSVEPATSPLPERIRIHSDALLQIFEILGSDGRSLLGLDNMTAVFTRPYEALIYQEEALRGWCRALEREFNVRITNDNDHPVKVDASETISEEQRSARAHDIVANEQTEGNTHINEALTDQQLDRDSEDNKDEGEERFEAKRNYLDSPQCRKVFFSDLWQLFRPGVEVIGSDGKQAYRVIGVTSAKHRVAPHWERWSKQSKRLDRKGADLRISCVYIDFDGNNIGPVANTFDFERFDGQKEVTSLKVYPLRFHPIRRSEYTDADWEKLENIPTADRYRQKLTHRGAKFLDAAGGKHMYYAGSTLDAKEEVESPVVIDFETTFVMHDVPRRSIAPSNGMLQAHEPRQHSLPSTNSVWKPHLSTIIGMPAIDNGIKNISCNGDCCREDFVHDDQHVDRKQSSEYIESLLPKAGSLDEQPSINIMPRPLKSLRTGPTGDLQCSNDEPVIMSYRVFSFVLRSRKFGNEMQPESKLVFDRLVLEEGHYSMIVSLIAQHFRDKKSTTGQREEFDIVKGQGNANLSTKTTEGVAEKFKKPLFQITCGDLGTTATEVKNSLEKSFSLANKWDCILLLDEADVFLTERSKEDFKRNGLVAVFLRLMEYYSGILFLTTNRVGDFDEAFTSRIHVSLYYPALNESKTVKVFKINLDMIEERFNTKGRAIEIDRMEIGGYAARYFADHPDERWNGRQIRNACQTALALAEFEAQGHSLKDTEDPNIVVKLRVGYFEIVRNAYLEFTKYMHNLYGTSDARRAKESRLRAIFVDENGRVVTAQNMDSTRIDKNVFLRASQSPRSHPPGHSPQHSFQQPSYQQQGRYQQSFQQSSQQQHERYPPQSLNSGIYQPQQPYSSHQVWGSQPARTSGPFVPEPQQERQFQGQTPRRQVVTPSPCQSQKAQPAAPWLNEDTRGLHTALGQQDD